MIIEHTGKGCVVRAPAKLNLFLEVLGKRPDGYHELETVMVATQWYDELTLKEGRPDTQIELSCDGADLPTDQSNLVLRAAHVLCQSVGRERPAVIELTKRIPVGAGLGGGSSDAAATLVGLNLLWDLKLAHADLVQLAAEIGSDVPFFLYGPAAVCRGRGEQVTPLCLGSPLHVVVVCPRQGLSTARVFARLKPPVPGDTRSVESMCEALRQGRLDQVAHGLFNRLEAPAYAIDPSLAELHAQLGVAPAQGSLMTGSGSAHFALCPGAGGAHRLAQALRAKGWERVVVTGTACPQQATGKENGGGNHRSACQTDAGQGGTPPGVL